jgi:hypothetical protein
MSEGRVKRLPPTMRRPISKARFAGQEDGVMTSSRCAAVFAVLLIGAALAGPAIAASSTSLSAKSAWSAMDRCTKTAREMFPDQTADALAKRDAYVHNCQRDGRVPIREGAAPKK